MNQSSPRPLPKSPIELELITADGVFTFDPNTGAMWGVSGKLPSSKPVPHLHSDLSGEERAVLYRCTEGELALTEEELMRLLRLNLRPEEVDYLRSQFGDWFEWHSDFYDRRGRALQPR